MPQLLMLDNSLKATGQDGDGLSKKALDHFTTYRQYDKLCVGEFLCCRGYMYMCIFTLFCCVIIQTLETMQVFVLF